MKSLSDSSFQGGKHALQGERIAIVIPGFHESKVVDTWFPCRHMIWYIVIDYTFVNPVH